MLEYTGKDLVSKGGYLEEDPPDSGIYVVKKNKDSKLTKEEVKTFQDEINRIHNNISYENDRYKNIVKYTNETILGSMNDINEFKNLLDQSQKLYGGWNAFTVEAEASFNKMALAIPMLFQNKSAISNYGSISKTVEMKLPPKLTYDEAISRGLKAEYTGRVSERAQDIQKLAIEQGTRDNLQAAVQATTDQISTLELGVTEVVTNRIKADAASLAMEADEKEAYIVRETERARLAIKSDLIHAKAMREYFTRLLRGSYGTENAPKPNVTEKSTVAEKD